MDEKPDEVVWAGARELFDGLAEVRRAEAAVKEAAAARARFLGETFSPTVEAALSALCSEVMAALEASPDLLPGAVAARGRSGDEHYFTFQEIGVTFACTGNLVSADSRKRVKEDRLSPSPKDGGITVALLRRHQVPLTDVTPGWVRSCCLLALDEHLSVSFRLRHYGLGGPR